MRILRLGVVCAVPLLLIACGGGSKGGGSSGGSSGGGGNTPVMESVGGLVSKGPVAGATINVHRLNSDGTPGTRVAGPITTGEDGSWNVQIDASVPRPLAVISSGGTYTDEATGNPVNAGELNSFLPEDADTVAVTPLTDMLVKVTRNHIASNPGATVHDGLTAGRSTLASVLSVGFDPLQVTPANPANTSGASADQIAYAAVLGGLSQLANTVAPAADPFTVMQALVNDMTDGTIDGQDSDGPVTVGEDDLVVGGNTLTDAIDSFTTNTQGFDSVAVYTAAFSSVGENGSVSPVSKSVLSGGAASFTLMPAQGFSVDAVEGCDGTQQGNTYTTGTLTASCDMSVTFALTQYDVAAQAGAGGSITPQQETYEHGNVAGFEITPDEGYSIASVTGCGGTLEGNIYTTAAITDACTVSATFSLINYTVSTDLGAGGASITPESSSVGHGNTGSFTITPQTGFNIASVSGCGDGALEGNVYTTAAITEACTVSASFALRSYTVNASAGTGGSISPESVSAGHGTTTAFTLSTETGYEIASVSGCGGTLEGNTYSTGAITSACTVSASFSLIQIAVSTQAGPNGSISPASRSVAYGTTTTFTFEAAQGYQLASAIGCGGSLNGGLFTTGEITSPCTVSASFEAVETPSEDAVWDQFDWDAANWQ